MTIWLAAAALVVLKLLSGADLPVQIAFSPHDDSLYVERALHFLRGEGFGPYDSRVLGKYPGISLWLAAVRSLGVPFLVSINALYIGAGAYLMAAFLRAGVNRWVALGAFALYLFNPITFGFEWIRVIREPLDTGLLILMVAAIAHVLVALKDARLPWGHVVVFAFAFAFSLFVREENRLLWGFLGLFAASLAWLAFRSLPGRQALAVVALGLLLPAALGKAHELALRDFAERHYGLPILHELSEGEFPRMLAAIRSVESSKDNRLVMVSQEVLKKLEKEVPAFAPVVHRLPPPGPGTISCQLHGVCSEWSNGWMPFWIKDEAFRAGLTPNLVAAQAYFRRVRLEIEKACSEKRLQCVDRGEGFLAPMELRWTRAYVAGGWQLAKMLLAPAVEPVSEAPVVYNVPVELGRAYQTVTMTHHFDSEYEAHLGMGHSTQGYTNSAAGVRRMLLSPYQVLAAALILAALGAFFLRVWIVDRAPFGPVALLVFIVAGYSILRLAALTYVSVFLGPFTSRIVFSTYAVTVVLTLPFIVETICAWRSGRTVNRT